MTTTTTATARHIDDDDVRSSNPNDNNPGDDTTADDDDDDDDDDDGNPNRWDDEKAEQGESTDEGLPLQQPAAGKGMVDGEVIRESHPGG